MIMCGDGGYSIASEFSIRNSSFNIDNEYSRSDSIEMPFSFSFRIQIRLVWLL